MSTLWLDILAVIAAQHLWQSALLLLLAWLVFKLRPLGADARSWVWLCVFALAAAAPLAVLLPGSDPASLAQATPNGVPLASADGAPAHSVVGADHLISMARIKTVALLIWSLGFAWSLARLFAGWNAARRLRDTSRTAHELERLLACELPLHASIRFSDAIASPMVVGLWRPCILVPQALAAELPQAVLTDILRHEIAHVRRRDLPMTLLQRVLLALYWWSPLLRLIGARLDLAREMACDERAARRSGEGRDYARSLLRGADRVRAHDTHAHLLASGIFESRKGLARRIEGLLEMDTTTLRAGTRQALIACTLVLAISLGLALALTPRMGHSAFATAGGDASAALLVEAADSGDLHEVRRLLDSGISIDARLPGEGTALIVAARNGDLAMVKALLGAGASVDLPSLRDGNPLIMAAQRGHHAVVDALIEAGADVNAVVPYDETPLITAVRAGQFEIVQCLVEKGADVNLGVHADFGLRSPLNQARDSATRDYLIRMGAQAKPTGA
jgi:beta-lactamase regulating signal transducer with metallopeptidase domain